MLHLFNSRTQQGTAFPPRIFASSRQRCSTQTPPYPHDAALRQGDGFRGPGCVGIMRIFTSICCGSGEVRDCRQSWLVVRRYF